jgi:hypothetical protein
METDIRNKHLGTGDVNGVVKIWDIEQYCLQLDSSDIEKSLPRMQKIFENSCMIFIICSALLAEFTPHSDSVTCIDFLEKDERIYVLTSSSDCSVVLSDINGNSYGTFGQPNQWRLDMDLSKPNDEDSPTDKNKTEDESEEGSFKKIDEESRSGLSHDLDDLSSITDEDMLTRRSNVWESTSIGNSIHSIFYKFCCLFISGVSFQEKRTNRRQRNQPSLITKKDYLLWEKTGLAPGGAYGVSEILIFFQRII